MRSSVSAVSLMGVGSIQFGDFLRQEFWQAFGLGQERGVQPEDVVKEVPPCERLMPPAAFVGPLRTGQRVQRGFLRHRQSCPWLCGSNRFAVYPLQGCTLRL